MQAGRLVACGVNRGIGGADSEWAFGPDDCETGFAGGAREARFGRASDLPAHLLTGIEGEDAARSYLQRKDYIVVARRWSSGNLPGDLDLIAWQGRCFVSSR